MEDGAGKVFGEQEVGAFSNMLDGPREAVPVEACELLDAAVFNVACALYFHPESVVGAEVVVALKYHTTQIYEKYHYIC
jgi:hypothetical protein